MSPGIASETTRELVLEETLELEVERRLEEQPRQEYGVEQILGEDGRLQRTRGAERQTGDDERHGVRELEPARDERDGRRDGEQRDDRDFDAKARHEAATASNVRASVAPRRPPATFHARAVPGETSKTTRVAMRRRLADSRPSLAEW